MENKASLRNNRGNERTNEIENKVSDVLVFMPIASEIPDHASPKKAIVKKMSKIPMTPVVTLAPKT
jgi:hypothetical protein